MDLLSPQGWASADVYGIAKIHQWSKINHVNVLIKLPVLECEIQSSHFAWDWRILEHWFPFVQHWFHCVSPCSELGSLANFEVCHTGPASTAQSAWIRMGNTCHVHAENRCYICYIVLICSDHPTKGQLESLACHFLSYQSYLCDSIPLIYH
jgi:hypothetical protein